jgi:serine/threonine protein kinase
MCKTLASHSKPDSLVLHETISSSKFHILLAKCPTNSMTYIVKSYTTDANSSSSYTREKQVLSSIDHQHVIRYMPESMFLLNMPQSNYIVMEYAPYGDFFNFILDHQVTNETLVRTYFRQLVHGLEHLHSQGIAHLDIKLENLLIGDDFLLKIADFDVSQKLNDIDMLSRGSENYRAPEVRSGICKNYCAADVFSAGVCLFALTSKAFPFIEKGDDIKGKLERYDKFLKKNGQYWTGIEALLGNKVQFSKTLRELLNGMLMKDPSERLSLEQIKESQWYNEPTYSYEELQREAKKLFDSE